MSPAKNVRVEINEDEKTAHVFVPSEELSLAIGREGQNVRLASKLTKYRIEIEGEPTVAEAMAGKETSENIKNKNGKIEEVKKEEKEMSPKIQKKSRKAGSGSARKKSTKKAKKAGKKSKEESA